MNFGETLIIPVQSPTGHICQDLPTGPLFRPPGGGHCTPQKPTKPSPLACSLPTTPPHGAFLDVQEGMARWGFTHGENLLVYITIILPVGQDPGQIGARTGAPLSGQTGSRALRSTAQ